MTRTELKTIRNQLFGYFIYLKTKALDAKDETNKIEYELEKQQVKESIRVIERILK